MHQHANGCVQPLTPNRQQQAKTRVLEHPWTILIERRDDRSGAGSCLLHCLMWQRFDIKPGYIIPAGPNRSQQRVIDIGNVSALPEAARIVRLR